MNILKLIGRDSELFTSDIQHNEEQLTHIVSNSKFLVVGGAGSIGQAVTKEIFRRNPRKLHVVDISETSLDMTKKIYKKLELDKKHIVNFTLSDINLFKTGYLYDFIVMGEVLEHVENPGSILDKLYSLLAEDGKIYISTCSNCPAIDHITYFQEVEDIRSLVLESKFKILEECIAPSENMSEEKLRKFKIDIVYAAILVKEK